MFAMFVAFLAHLFYRGAPSSSPAPPACAFMSTLRPSFSSPSSSMPFFPLYVSLSRLATFRYTLAYSFLLCVCVSCVHVCEYDCPSSLLQHELLFLLPAFYRLLFCSSSPSFFRFDVAPFPPLPPPPPLFQLVHRKRQHTDKAVLPPCWSSCLPVFPFVRACACVSAAA